MNHLDSQEEARLLLAATERAGMLGHGDLGEWQRIPGPRGSGQCAATPAAAGGWFIRRRLVCGVWF